MRYSLSSTDPEYETKPFIDGGVTLIGGKISPWNGTSDDVTSPIIDASTGERIIIGKIAHMTETAAIEAFEAGKLAWNNGTGEWPQMSAANRIKAIQNVVSQLREKRSEIINVLMWEICKNKTDAEAEFDRTMLFIDGLIKAMHDLENTEGGYITAGGVFARYRRNAIGVMLALGPFNYPFNETYTTIIPALLMGNIIVMKIPTTGGLSHVLTMQAYANYLPPGVVNFISGSGRETMGPVMSAGPDLLAFIGGSSAADALLKEHPHPHRLKTFLSLEGKNLGIVTPDADIDVAVEQCTMGSTTYNGQRCTAIKMIFVHVSIAEEFVTKMSIKVSALKVGLPWDDKVVITPLPEPNRPGFMQELISDAISKGAAIVNEDGGVLEGSLMKPALIFPVNSDMKLWHLEQFGPVVPIAVYKTDRDVMDYIYNMPYGQQAAIFTTSSDTLSPFIDTLATAVGRININTQCSRSPDVLPFSGRRSSALGTLSITESLKAFSIETVIAAKALAINEDIIKEAEKTSTFLAKL